MEKTVMGYRILAVLLICFACYFPQQSAGQFGGSNTKQILVKYKGDWRPVVGAEGDFPLALLEDGSIKLVKSPVYSAITKMLKAPGIVTVHDKLQRYADLQSDRTGHMKISTNKDFDDLYVVLLHRYQGGDNDVINVSVHEIGSIKANTPTKVSFQIGYIKQGVIPTPVLYHKGFPLRTKNTNRR